MSALAFVFMTTVNILMKFIIVDYEVSACSSKAESCESSARILTPYITLVPPKIRVPNKSKVKDYRSYNPPSINNRNSKKLSKKTQAENDVHNINPPNERRSPSQNTILIAITIGVIVLSFVACIIIVYTVM